MTSQLLKMSGIITVLACGTVHAAPSPASDAQIISSRNATTANGHFFGISHRNTIKQIGKSAHGRVLPVTKPSMPPGGLPKAVRFRGPAPAIVGGPSIKAKSTASINGTGMKRRW